MIDYNEILNKVATQLYETMDKNPELYGGYKIYVTKEQQYLVDKPEGKAKEIYVVVHFLEASINFGQTILPFTINVVSEQNSFEVAQQLFLDYALTYNLKQTEDATEQQFYSSPTILNNFNEVYDGFRSLLYLTGSIRIAENSLAIKTIEVKNDDGTYYEIPKLASTINGNQQLDSQAFYTTQSNAIAEGKVKAFTLSFTTNLYDKEFYNKVIRLMFGMEQNYNDTKFTFKITYTNGLSFEIPMIYVDTTQADSLGQLTAVNLTFARTR